MVTLVLLAAHKLHIWLPPARNKMPENTTKCMVLLGNTSQNILLQPAGNRILEHRSNMLITTKMATAGLFGNTNKTHCYHLPAMESESLKRQANCMLPFVIIVCFASKYMQNTL